ncbi:MAG TPA: type I-U CRISPR-associated protein Csb2 [Bryobacteraceae bacterium]|nr:type I-U CRISPR-associated protein Csb2 [Bryobacteraceae bacterium]
MLSLGIRYLTGCAVASDVDNRGRTEWPPHPSRVFMALAAAHFETGEDLDERAALEWLEQQAAPQIKAPEYNERAAVTQFVPVNDVAGPSTAPVHSALGFSRKRQPREFAKAWIDDENVFLHWPEVDPGQHFSSLQRLCEKVTRIGHSASLVQMWASQEAPNTPANWLPDEGSPTERFRVPSPGTIQYLERQFNRLEVDAYFELIAIAADDSDRNRQRDAKLALKVNFVDQAPTRLRPELSITHGYVPRGVAPTTAATGTVFNPHLLVFALQRKDGPYRYLDLSATLQVTGRLRESLLSHLGTDIPEVLSGHRGNGRSERPHVSVFPLPFVGRTHAHGGILGVALAVPREIDEADWQKLCGALTKLREEGLKLGALGRWGLEAPIGAAWRDTLRDRAWTHNPQGARKWATVTPYVFDRHAKAKDKAAYEAELADSVRKSWERMRQSQTVSVEVVVTPVSAHVGAPPAYEFPRLQRKDGSECRHSHAILIFSEAVVGPVLLGAGRYRGYGLCRPLLGQDT